jgi:hypothetical protein
MSTAATSPRTPAPPSLTRDERAARNGRGIAFAGLGFGIYLLLIALLMLYPDPGANVLGFIFMALAGGLFTVTGAVGVARSAKRMREFNATRGALASSG